MRPVPGRVITAEEGEKNHNMVWSPDNRILVEDEYLTDLSVGVKLFHLIDRQIRWFNSIAITALFWNPVDGDETKVNGVSVGLADKWVVVPTWNSLVQAARES
jgi:hypothetical protein